MTNKITSRDFEAVDAQMDAASLAKRYDNMVGKVIGMLNDEGPTYSTWIRFQVGKTKPLTFTTASTSNTQNLIADLEVEKAGAGIANSFKINIRYDPFNYGQNPDDRIELLDDLVANAMSFDLKTDGNDSQKAEDLNFLRGYIQYGYNCATDTKLVSPKYQFIMTNATSSMRMQDGITTYTFEGTSDLAIDCDYNVPFPEFKDKNLLEIITTVLYCYYGDDTKKPNHVLDEISFVENEYKYEIEISEDLYTEARKVSIPASSEISPWQYCKNLFSQYISATDTDDEKYKNLATLKSNERPYYQLYITDTAGKKVIHVTYISPLNDDNASLDYEFTWGLDKQSIVQEWNPQVDLRLYLIRKAMALRNARNTLASTLGSAMADAVQNESLSAWASGLEDFSNGKRVDLGDGWWNDFWEGVINSKPVQGLAGVGSDILGLFTNEVKLNAIKQFLENSQIVDEMYDAELTIIGIPADLPVACEVRIKPRILSSVSRTAGIYRVISCTDRISSRGIFESNIKLLRLRAIS